MTPCSTNDSWALKMGGKFSHTGVLPEVGQKQKTEKKEERRKRERLKVGNNNGQLRIANQRRKKYPNLRNRFAENIWALEGSQKILAENHALSNRFLMIQRLVKYMV